VRVTARAAMRDALGVGLREWRTVAVLLAANWLVAALMVTPVLPGLLSAFGHAPLGAGKPILSSELLGGLGAVIESGRAPSVLGPLLLLVLLQTFLTGGVVWRVCAGGPFRLGAFFGQSGRLVGRNARLFLWLLLLLAVAMVVPLAVGAGMQLLGLRTSLTGPGEVWIFGNPFGGWSPVLFAVLGLAIALWRLSLDVGRVLLFRQDVRNTRRAAWRAFRLVLRSPLSVVLYALLGLLASGAVLLAARGRASLPEGSAGLALLALGVGQVVIWLRLAFQIAGTRFAAALVERLDATPATDATADGGSSG